MRVCFEPPTDTGGSPVTEYQIETDTSSAFDAATTRVEYLKFLAGGSPFCFTINHLTTGTEYFVRVAAGNAQGFGEPQSPTPVSEHPRQAPKGPTSVVAGVTSDTKITVGWEPPVDDGGDPIITYRVQWDTDPEFLSLDFLPHKGETVVLASQNRSITISDLTPNQRYYFRVAAANLEGYGLTSSPVPAYLAPSRQVPGLPTFLQVTNTTGAVGQVLILMSAPVVPHHGIFCSGGADDAPFADPNPCPVGMGVGRQADGGSRVTKYEIEYSEDPNFDTGRAKVWREIDVSETDDGPFTFLLDLGASSVDSMYYFRVAAINAQSIGQYCNRGGLLCDGNVLAIQPQRA